MPFAPSAPHRIETQRLMLCHWQPADAAELVALVTANLEHLRPWMPWAATEPETVEAKAARIRKWNQWFERGSHCLYGMFLHEGGELLGAIGSHRDIGSGAMAIGYWIRKDFIGRGLVTEAAAALTRIAFEVEGLVRVEIHCDPTNVASAAIPRRLGFHEWLLIAECVSSPTVNPRDTIHWVMTATSYPASAAARYATTWFDADSLRQSL